MLNTHRLARWLMREIHGRQIRRKPRKKRFAVYAKFRPAPPARDWKYRAFIRQHPCCACGSSRDVECAHTGAHALKQKASDYDCIPLCAWCHRGKTDSLHNIGPAEFQERNEISLRRVILEMRKEWRAANAERS